MNNCSTCHFNPCGKNVDNCKAYVAKAGTEYPPSAYTAKDLQYYHNLRKSGRVSDAVVDKLIRERRRL